MPDSLTSTLAALADPTRRAILARLSRGQLSVTALAEPFDISLPAVSKHLKVLARVIKVFGAIEGGNQTLARLAEYLPSLGKANSPPA